MIFLRRETLKDSSKLKVIDPNDNDSVEGIMFTKNEAVIMTGKGASANHVNKKLIATLNEHLRKR